MNVFHLAYLFVIAGMFQSRIMAYESPYGDTHPRIEINDKMFHLYYLNGDKKFDAIQAYMINFEKDIKPTAGLIEPDEDICLIGFNANGNLVFPAKIVKNNTDVRPMLSSYLMFNDLSFSLENNTINILDVLFSDKYGSRIYQYDSKLFIIPELQSSPIINYYVVSNFKDKFNMVSLLANNITTTYHNQNVVENKISLGQSFQNICVESICVDNKSATMALSEHDNNGNYDLYLLRCSITNDRIEVVKKHPVGRVSHYTGKLASSSIIPYASGFLLVWIKAELNKMNDNKEPVSDMFMSYLSQDTDELKTMKIVDNINVNTSLSANVLENTLMVAYNQGEVTWKKKSSEIFTLFLDLTKCWSSPIPKPIALPQGELNGEPIKLAPKQ